MTTETALTPEQEAEKIWAEEASKREAAEAAEQEKPAAEELPVEATEEQKDEEPAVEAKEETVEDPYAGLPEAAKERLRKLDELERSQAQLLHHVKTAEGRVAAMQRELAEAKKAQAAAGDAPSGTQIAAATRSTEKWEQLKQDFPEWAEAMESFVAANLPTRAAGPDPEDFEQKVSERTQAAVAEFEMARVERKHRGWRDIVRGDDFANWLQAQPDEVKSLASSPVSDDAIDLLDRFKASREVKQERLNRLAAAAGVKPSQASAPAAKSIDDMTPEELWAYEAKQREKRRTNLYG